MIFLIVFLQNFEPSCEIRAFYVAIFRKVLYRKWLPLALSVSQYHALFADIILRGGDWRIIRAHQAWKQNSAR